MVRLRIYLVIFKKQSHTGNFSKETPLQLKTWIQFENFNT